MQTTKVKQAYINYKKIMSVSKKVNYSDINKMNTDFWEQEKLNDIC